MKTPPGLDNWLSSTLVSLTLLMFAALMLVAPLYRVLAANWPVSIVEHVDRDGRVNLLESIPSHGDGGEVRSRPLNAARVEFENGSSILGYVVALRADDKTPRHPPGGSVWRPSGRQCEVALKSAAQTIEWFPCARVSEISRPNRMSLLARARLAFSRAIAGLPGH